jgi:hypothetical protein
VVLSTVTIVFFRAQRVIQEDDKDHTWLSGIS